MPLFSEELRALLEAILFAAGEPVNLKRLVEIVGTKETEVLEVITDLKESFQNAERGLQLLEVAGGYQLTTKPQYAPYVEKIYRPQVNALSQAALETVAIVAYEQPITRVEIEQIRGVKADGVLGTLLDRGLIQEVGRREGPGRPILYGTTERFLNHFGLRDVTELPQIETANSESANE